MEVLIKTKVFQDERCTCECGNTHELYGGKGYNTIVCQGINGRNGFYLHKVKCNSCRRIHTLKLK